MTGFFSKFKRSYSDKVQKVIMGLGNPGKQYEKNRHSFGFMVIDQIAESNQMTFRSSGKSYLWSETNMSTNEGDIDICLCKPITYMNNSGVAARHILSWYNLMPEDLLVIYDDIDLPLGKFRLRKQGSSGGHKGIQSIINQLQNKQFPRLRLGIGPQDVGVPAEDFVLDNFRKNELKTVEKVIDKSVEVIHDYLDFTESIIGDTA
jgi:PTH1 family peptidyl-tRNA hydrolase